MKHSEEDHTNGCTLRCWPLPWRIAAALALESKLDWARWAYGITRPYVGVWPSNTEAACS